MHGDTVFGCNVVVWWFYGVIIGYFGSGCHKIFFGDLAGVVGLLRLGVIG